MNHNNTGEKVLWLFGSKIFTYKVNIICCLAPEYVHVTIYRVVSQSVRI